MSHYPSAATKTIAISYGKRANQRLGWRTQTVTLESFVSALLKHREVSQKDGACFLAGGLSGDERKAQSVTRIDCLIYDIDGAEPYEQVLEKLKSSGCTCVLYTTYSHRKTTTKINSDAYKKWAAKANEVFPPTKDSLLRYMQVIKPDNILQNVEFDIHADKDKFFVHDNGFMYVLHHDPVDRLRVVVPLAKSIVISELGSTFTEAAYTYKTIYVSVGRYLELPFDESGASLEHMFYFPGHPKGAADYAADVVNWDNANQWKYLLDVDAVPRVSLKHSYTEKLTNAGTPKDQRVVTDKTGVRIDVERWTQDNPDFDIESLLRDRLPEDHVRGDRSTGEGFHIKCPHEHVHSAPGGLGTYVVNGDGTLPWVIHCVHNTCKNVHQYTRWHHLRELINEGYITAKDLGVISLEGTAASPPAVAAVVNDPATVEAKVISILDVLGERTKEADTDDTLAAAAADAEEASRIEQATREIVQVTQLLGNDYSRKEKVQLAEIAAATGEPQQVAEVLEIIEETPPTIATSDEDFFEFVRTAVDTLRKLETPQAISHCLRSISDYCHNELLLPDVALEIGDILGASDIGNSTMMRIMRHCQSYTNLDAERILETARIKRQQRVNLSDELQAIIHKRTTGIALQVELLRIADKLLQPKQIIAKALDDAGHDEYTTEFDRTIADEMRRLDAQYGKIVLGATCWWIDMPASRQKMAPVLLSDKAMMTRFRNRTVKMVKASARGVRSVDVNIVDAWQKSSVSIKEFAGLTFHPGEGPITSDNKFNLWSVERRFAVAPIAGDATPILQHIKEVWANDDTLKYNWILTWLAHIIQRPGEKPSSALVLTGVEGTGKSLVIESALGPILGDALWGMSSDKDHIIGRFNSHLETKLMWLAEECMFGSDKPAMQKLKDRISAKTISIEPKGLAVYQVPNFTRYVFTSNALHSLALARGDRRFMIVECSPRYVGNRAYFGTLLDWLKNKRGLGKFLHFLLEFKPESVGLSWTDLNYPPITQEKITQQLYTQSAHEAFFHTLLKYGCIPTQEDDSLTISWPVEIPQDENGDPRKGASYAIPINTMRNAFMSYVTSNRTGNKGLANASFELSFRNALGNDVSEYLSRNGKTLVLDLPPRRVILERLVAEGKMLQVDLDSALQNTDSHKGVGIGDFVL